LFDVLNRTRTSMGARMLKKWLLKPLIDPTAINRRLDMVEKFVSDALLLAETRELLKGIPDLERTLSKISLGSRNPRDLQALSLGLSRVPAIVELLLQHDLEQMASGFKPLQELTALIDAHLLDELPAVLTDGGVIRSGINAELDELRSLLRDGDEWLRRYEETERQRTGIKTLKVRKNSVFGFFIEISKSLADQAPENYVRKQTLTTGERFITAELKDYENKVFTASEKSTGIEKEIYEGLVKRALEDIPAIKENANALASADVISSLAQLATETRCCRPVVDGENRINIIAGRHPVVEKFLDSGEFHPNDLRLDGERRQAIITGPNMAGKSTYLRQAAL
ncbi:MAG TPA: DNA mismatch repair protein MutS, partial [Candidatus Rifleibacterium sp.]|nr:DNA mismatch repair protein MutS [Candidatus Rifleibacterium sp.]